MRTNIEIDDELMRKAMKASGLKTKRAVVEQGLQHVIRISEQSRALLKLRGIGWDGDLDAWRRDKPRS